MDKEKITLTKLLSMYKAIERRFDRLESQMEQFACVKNFQNRRIKYVYVGKCEEVDNVPVEFDFEAFIRQGRRANREDEK